jgi:hypothetical protein
VGDYGNLWGETRRTQPVLGERTLPVGRDGGDSIYFLNYATGETPSVWCLRGDTRKRFEVTPCFESLIDMLQLPTDG